MLIYLIILPIYIFACFVISMVYLTSEDPDLKKATDKKCAYTFFNFLFWPIFLSCSIIRGVRKSVIYLVKNARSLLIGFFWGVVGISWEILRFSWVYIKDTINWTFRT